MMMKTLQQTGWILAVLTAVVAGCDKDEPKVCQQPESKFPEAFLRTDWPLSKAGPTAVARRSYRLRESDMIEVIYFVKTYEKQPVYRVKVRDILEIRFPFNQNLDVSEAEVQPDGTVALPLIQRVEVFDRTVPEIQSELVKRYAKYIKEPTLTISLKESGEDILDLKDAIKTSSRGQSRLVPVTPGGMVALPLIGSVSVGGKTIDEARAEVQKRYVDLGFNEIDVTVNVNAVAPLRAYVMGEVQKPGVIMNNSGTQSGSVQMTLLQAIAQAGSYLPKRAELSKVLLIRRSNLPAPEVAVVDLHQFFMGGTQAKNGPFVPNSEAFRRDIWLEDGDVIYVPTKELAKRADYIEYVWTRGIYAVVPMSYSINYDIVDSVKWLGPNP